jgi:hypothetical protein
MGLDTDRDSGTQGKTERNSSQEYDIIFTGSLKRIYKGDRRNFIKGMKDAELGTVVDIEIF